MVAAARIGNRFPPVCFRFLCRVVFLDAAGTARGVSRTEVPPLQTVAAGGVAIAVLAVMAYAMRTTAAQGDSVSRKAPSPWLAGLGTLVGFVWYGLIVLVFAPQPSLPLWIPMAGGIASALAFFVINRWVTSSGWGDLLRWTLVSSAILVCMVAGFLGSSTWSRMDLIGKVALNVIAVVLLLLLGKSILARKPSPTVATTL